MVGPTERELAQRWPLIMATCMGIISSSFVLPYYSIGALLTPVTEEFGWSRAQFQAAILFSSGLGALTSPIIGWLNDKYGPRRVALPSMIGLSLGLLTASQIKGDLWMLFLAYGMMALLGAGTIPVTWTRAIATSFFKRRGLALGLALTGTGICASVAPHYTVWLTDQFGWRGAYVGLALVPLLLAWPMLYLLFRPLDAHSQTENHEPETSAALESGLTLGEAVRGYRFWVLLLSILFAYQGFSGIGPNLLPSLTDDGFSREQAASVLATVHRDADGWSEEEAEFFKAPIRQKYEEEGNPYHATARLWDDGVIDPAQTRDVLGLAFAATLEAQARVGEIIASHVLATLNGEPPSDGVVVAPAL